MKLRFFWTPARLIAATFLVAIIIGALLLIQPWATKGAVGASFIDALFTASSAVCVTGLVVQDTPNFFSSAGLIVILLLIQIGGLSIITLSAALPIMFGKAIKVGYRDLIVNYMDLSGYVDESGYIKLLLILKKVIKYTFLIEFIGMVILTLHWYAMWGDFGKALAFGVFHSVSAFCNAGFSLFTDNLVQFRNDPVVNIVILSLVFFGGLGFLVIYDIFSYRRFKQYSFHSKLVLAITAIIIFFPSLFIFFSEFSRAFIDYPMVEKIFASIFPTICARTAGFSTYDLNILGNSSLFIICILMFIGAAPGSTAGGIKVTTLGILFLSIRAVVLGRERIEVFGRRITQSLVTKTIAIVSIYTAVQVLSIVLLLITETASFRDIVFESVSAHGTVGLSLGITPDLTPLGKFIISLTMYFGRIGPLVAVFLVGARQEKISYKYPEGNAMVG